MKSLEYPLWCLRHIFTVIATYLSVKCMKTLHCHCEHPRVKQFRCAIGLCRCIFVSSSPLTATHSKQVRAETARSRRATQSPQGVMSWRMFFGGFGLRIHSETCGKVKVSSPPKQQDQWLVLIPFYMHIDFFSQPVMFHSV